MMLEEQLILYCNLVKETIENAKKAAPSKSEEKPDAMMKQKQKKLHQKLFRRLIERS